MKYGAWIVILNDLLAVWGEEIPALAIYADSLQHKIYFRIRKVPFRRDERDNLSLPQFKGSARIGAYEALAGFLIGLFTPATSK